MLLHVRRLLVSRTVQAVAAVLVVAGAIAVWRNPSTLSFAVMAVLAMGVLAQPETERVPVSSYGLPGVADGLPLKSTVPARTYFAVSAGAAVIALALAVSGADATAFSMLLILAAVGWAAGAHNSWLNLRQRRRVIRGLRQWRPTVGIGYAGKSGGPWQLRMWEPYILRSGQRGVIFNVHAKYADMILEGGDLRSPFVQLGSRGTRELRGLIIPSLRALFYVQNAQRNADFMKFKNITHVWLNHGDSDKPANFNPRHGNYDMLVVCGQAGIDRYERNDIRIPHEKFAVLGRPQALGVEPARGRIGELERQTVLYAPTWQGLEASVNFSSLERGPELIRALIARGATVIFRPHPLSYRWRIRRAVIAEIHQILEADRAASGRCHVWGERAEKTWNVVDCANHADALISDVSSVVSDFLQSEKPYAMMSMRSSIEDFAAEFPLAQTSYVILGDLSNLDEQLDRLLGTDPLRAQRSERKRYVLGDFTGEQSAEAFAQFVEDLVGAERRPSAS